MKSANRVYWANIAEADLVGIIEYIAEDSVANAEKVFGTLKEKATSLHQLPERGRIVPELKDHGVTLYRELIVNPWRIIYRISGKNIYILSVLDSRQNVEDILLRRFL